jgi:drug/metabolite transporter (DMT)-like permease
MQHKTHYSDARRENLSPLPSACFVGARLLRASLWLVLQKSPRLTRVFYAILANMNRFTGPFLVFLAAILWATDAPFRVHLTQELASTFIVLGEHLIDVIIVSPILIGSWREIKGLSARGWLAILFIGIFGSALGSIAFTQAFHYVNPSVAIVLQKLQPIIAITLAALVLKESLRPRFWAFAALALFGAYLISFPNLIPQMYSGEVFNPNFVGVLFALLAAIFWGASTVFGKFVLRSTDFKVMTALRFVTAFIFLLFLNVQQHAFPSFGTFTMTDALFITIVAIVSGALSLFIYYRGLQSTQASVATIAELGFPVGAIFVNWLFIPGSALVPMQLVGVAILLFAVWRLAVYNTETA